MSLLQELIYSGLLRVISQGKYHELFFLTQMTLIQYNLNI